LSFSPRRRYNAPPPPGYPRGGIFVAMGIVNFILNLAGLLLWLNWRSNRVDPLVRRLPATLMGTLRPATQRELRRWHLLAFIAALLVVRALIYWQIGKETNWAGKLDLGVVAIWFASNSHLTGLYRMLLFSFASFGVMLGVFYLWVMILSLLAGPLPIHGLVTIPLGRVDGWPRWAKVVLPLVVTAASWWLASWLFARVEAVTPLSAAGRFQQGLVLGLASYFQWQYPVEAILLLHLLSSYIYFGRHPLWKYVAVTGQRILLPLRKIPLQLGKVDFAPLVGMALIFMVANCAEFGVKLPRIPGLGGWHIPGLVNLYAKLPF
jgi:uncharacterized protein YggT (Ycf19 family)